MKTAKEWFYSRYVVGIDDERNGTYEWFQKMEDYAKFYLDGNQTANKKDSEVALPIDRLAKYEIRKDKHGYPIAISKSGFDIIHLNPSERTSSNIEMIIKKLNT